MTYKSIDDSTRWLDDIRRESIFNILSTYTIEDYLSCTSIKQNYYNDQDFYDWVVNELLSHCNVYSTSRNVICMNNCTTHVHDRIRQAIETKECLIRYVSLYSSNLNSIKFIFELLKIWMRRHWRRLRAQFQEDFENFLRHTLTISECDTHAIVHFKYNNKDYDDYRFESDYETFRKNFETWANQAKNDDIV